MSPFSEAVVSRRTSWYVHGVEPLFPFDISEAMFLLPTPDADIVSTAALITWQAKQLQKRQEDIESMHEKVLLSRYASLKQFEA